MKINSISASNADFPEVLRHIPDSPKELFYVGNKDLLNSTSAVAIVGTRKPTGYGRSLTTKLSEGLARRNVTIISGLALGVDGLAHQGALTVGGHTIAVLGNGLDSIYPSSHRALAEDILRKNGLLVSEYTPSTPSLPHQFLERNRIVSGLSNAIIVTEAAAKSGTMNTVMHALAQDRDVYAVPGNITSPMSAGCNKLIEQGATPIADIEEFIEHIAPKETVASQPLLLAQTPDEQTILDLIARGIRDGDELQKRSKLTATSYSTTMTMLELRGVIHALGANMWSL